MERIKPILPSFRVCAEGITYYRLMLLLGGSPSGLLFRYVGIRKEFKGKMRSRCSRIFCPVSVPGEIAEIQMELKKDLLHVNKILYGI